MAEVNCDHAFEPTDRHTIKCSKCNLEKPPEMTSLPKSQPPPIVVAVALSLYAYNVSATERAEALVEKIGAPPSETNIFFRWLWHDGQHDLANWATEMPVPVAHAYIELALARYGEEAHKRVMDYMAVPPEQ